MTINVAPETMARKKSLTEKPLIIVGLAGKAYSGKSTAGEFIRKRHGGSVVPFMKRLKEMCGLFMSEDQISGSLKEVPDFCLLGGKTPREFMQKLATDFARKMIWEDFWLLQWQKDVRVKVDAGYTLIIADDIRLPNEIDLIHKMGGFVVHLDRSGSGSKVGATHSSENHDLICDHYVSTNSIFDMEVAMSHILDARHVPLNYGKGNPVFASLEEYVDYI